MQGFAFHRLRNFILLSFVFLAISAESEGQVSFSRKYRVVAYKSGQPSVFSVSNEVEIIPATSLYIPNTFTPNGDGMNDTFGVAGEAIKDFQMQIFNRWGQLIYETDNANDRWDGTHNGQKVQMGTYVYRVVASEASGRKLTKEGNLNVIL
jgi:gliding motility-associated-like protein